MGAASKNESRGEFEGAERLYEKVLVICTAARI